MNTRLTQIFSIGLISLTLVACAATDSNSKSPAADARASLGKITQKQTIQQYSQRRSSPVDVSVGVGGGGHVGWGVNVGLGQIFNLGQISSPEVMYRYTVQTNPNETFIVQTGDEFNVNDCVTLWQRTNDATYPRIRINSSCTLPR
jgi:Tfp pilus assembly protein PilW